MNTAFPMKIGPMGIANSSSVIVLYADDLHVFFGPSALFISTFLLTLQTNRR